MAACSFQPGQAMLTATKLYLEQHPERFAPEVAPAGCWLRFHSALC